jgi:hypothetical protein
VTQLPQVPLDEPGPPGFVEDGAGCTVRATAMVPCSVFVMGHDGCLRMMPGRVGVSG